MRERSQTTGNASRSIELSLANKTVYRDQALTDRIDGQEKTFESDRTEQSRTLRRNKTWSCDFITVHSQSGFSDRPNVSLTPRDHNPLRARGFQLKPFRQRFWHHTEGSPRVYQKLNFFNSSRRTREVTLYVEQPHIKFLLRDDSIVAQTTNNATTTMHLKMAAEAFDFPLEQRIKFEFVVNLMTAKQIGLTIPPNVLVRANKVIR